jgi:glucokinase
MPSDLFLAIDLGGTRVRAAIGGADGQLLRRAEQATNRDYAAGRPEDATGETIARHVGDVAEQVVGTDLARVKAIGVSAPGPLDARTGVLYHPVNLTRDDVPLANILHNRFGRPAYVQNDANCAALGESLFGGHGPTQHLWYLTVSTGVGSGIISHGQLIDGFNTTAGEIGHTVIDLDGPECGCGNRGCVEAICSGTSIARAAREALRNGRSSSRMLKLAGSIDGVTSAVVAQAAQEGDELAAGIFFRAADTLGAAVVNAIHMLSPEVIVIGGGVTLAGDLLFGPVRERVRRKAMVLCGRGVRIVPPSLGEDSGLAGAIALAMRQSIG